MRRLPALAIAPLLALAFGLLAAPARAAGPVRINLTWYGEVVRLDDGDTLEVRNNGTTVRVRLYGIDAPEKRQAYGRRATELTKHLAEGQIVAIRQVDRDRYGRIVAVVALPSGHVLQEQLLKAGFAWVYWDYIGAPVRDAWAALMSDAKRDRRGLWRDPKPTPPWVWRRTH